jgi:hypothetical protein
VDQDVVRRKIINAHGTWQDGRVDPFILREDEAKGEGERKYGSCQEDQDV